MFNQTGGNVTKQNKKKTSQDNLYLMTHGRILLPAKLLYPDSVLQSKQIENYAFIKKHTYFKKSTKQWSQTQNRKQRNQTPPNFIFFLQTLFSALYLHFVSLKHFSNIYFYLKDLRIKYSLCVLTRVRFICRFDTLAGKQKKILNTFLWNSDGRWISGQNRTC